MVKPFRAFEDEDCLKKQHLGRLAFIKSKPKLGLHDLNPFAMSDEQAGASDQIPIENTKQSTNESNSPFWIFDTEYEAIRDWVYWTEDHRKELQRINPAVKLPSFFLSFKNFFINRV